MAHKNILLTTMSIIHSKTSNAVNYYYDSTKEKYLTGIASIEPGAKHFLCTHNIQKIIILGSKETYNENSDVLTGDDLRNEFESVRNQDPKKMSDFTFFKYRLGQFLQNDSIEEVHIGDSIEESRKEEIKEIVRKTLEQNGLSDPRTWFSDIDTQSHSNLHLILRNAIKEDIEKNFVRPEDYDKYVTPDTFPEIADIKNEQLLAKYIEQQISDVNSRISEKRNSTTISNESYLSYALESLDSLRQRVSHEILVTDEDVHSEILRRLSLTIQNLIAEIRSLKNKRLDNENAYAKYYLFSEMGEEKKLQFKQKSKLAYQFIPEKTSDGSDNIVEILNGILGDQKDPINLYIDAQGGNRTDGYVRSAILSILNNDTHQNITIRNVIACNFERNRFANPIVDETSRYKISDLVAGMNAFIQYGRADLIEKYIKNAEIKDDYLDALVEKMVLIDKALSICDVDSLQRHIVSLKALFDSAHDISGDGAGVFKILENGIRKDYEIMFENDSNVISLAKWATEKKFIQQALTILESKVPEDIVRRGIRYYCDSRNNNKNDIISDFYSIYSLTSESNKYRFHDIDHYFIKAYWAEYNNISNSTKQQINRIRELTVAERSFAASVVSEYSKISKLRNTLNHAIIHNSELAGLTGCSLQENNPNWRNEVIENAVNDFINFYQKKVVDHYGFLPTVVRITEEEVINYTYSPTRTVNSTQSNTTNNVTANITNNSNTVHALVIAGFNNIADTDAISLKNSVISQYGRNTSVHFSEHSRSLLSLDRYRNNTDERTSLVTRLTTEVSEFYEENKGENNNIVILVDSRLFQIEDGLKDKFESIGVQTVEIAKNNRSYSIGQNRRRRR